MPKLSGKILIVDDDKDILLTTKVILKKHFSEIYTLSNPDRILSLLKDLTFDVILLDMNFSMGATSGKEGLDWLKKIRSLDIHISVIMITAYGEIYLAIKAMKEGAVDFVVKPWDNDKLLATVMSAYKLSQSIKEISRLQTMQTMLSKDIDQPFSEIIGDSTSMQEVFTTIHKVAKTDADVLILGENGTGKELVARALHRSSTRHLQPFINVDLGAIPDTLFESELFGHVKGAFTDAQEDRPGRFEVASGGTLFLDEIGNLTLALQSKLLTALQNREIVRIGSNITIPVNIRLICATNMDLHAMILENRFKQDLLYRINTVEIRIPPLRERKDDIPLLSKHFTKKYSLKYNKKVTVSKEAIKKLSHYDFPGNVRELQHIIERAIIMTESNTLYAKDFLLVSTSGPSSKGSTLNIEKLEKEAIEHAIKKCNGNLSKAAKELGLGRTTLYRKMEKYSI